MNKRKIILLIIGTLIIINVSIVSYKLYLYSHAQTGVTKGEFIINNQSSAKHNMIANLQMENSDTVAYLKVNGTNIDYPVMQSNDNDFYLKHDFNKNAVFAGSVFLDYRNDIEKIDKNNIIYAHAMNNGTMFGSLKNILTDEWLNNKDNHIITLINSSGVQKFEVISVYYIPVTNDYLYVNFDSDEEFLAFEEKMINRSMYDFGAKPNKNDKLLSLSTCKQHVERIVLHARLITD